MNLFERALLVEDEVNLAMTLQTALKKLGIESIHATTLQSASSRFEENHFDLVVLDRNLPDGDGLDFCVSLRSQGYTGCLLILTAEGHVEKRVEGLNAGADDYLPKPFSWDELTARVYALSRRQRGLPASQEEVLDWTLDEARLRIQIRSRWVVLTPLEFKLARRLIDAKGEIVSRDQLLKEVWGFTLLPKTRTVDHFMGRLRKHFEVTPDSPRHFLTVRGAGYRFES